MTTKQCYKCKKIKLVSEFLQYKKGINKGYYFSYCKKCWKKIEKQRLTLPWNKTYLYIVLRCRLRGKYFKRGIKRKITRKQLKELWYRDKAWLLKHPSIDRIDNDGNYVIENCRFIEQSENSRLGSLVRKNLKAKEGGR